MTVTVPAKDTVHAALQADITTLTNTIAASTNGKHQYDLTKLKAQKQLTLVLSLLAAGNLSAATVLSTMSYLTAQSGGDQA
jgi:hypothetical protein